MNSIIVKLKGGMGNQLFQYALGKNLAVKNNCKLVLDKSLYKHYTLHAYSLDPFNITDDFAQQSALPKQYCFNNKFIRKFFEIIDPLFFNGKIVKEKTMNFDDEIAKLNFEGTVYLDGYWQSEKYFIDNTNQIHDAFSLKTEITDNYFLELLEDIKQNDSVSLHVRRGSYTLPQYYKTHGVTSLDFYDKAVEYINQNVENPKFYIFSDDFDFVNEKFKNLKNAVIVKSSVDKDYLDLHLMSKCKHNIIANSSFSWWSAWLNRNKDKIVIAPSIWYYDEEKNKQTFDLIPSEWIRI